MDHGTVALIILGAVAVIVAACVLLAIAVRDPFDPHGPGSIDHR